MFKYQLAEALGKTLAEIDELPATELTGWAGYFIYRERERAKQEAIEKARAGSKGSGKTFGRG